MRNARKVRVSAEGAHFLAMDHTACLSTCFPAAGVCLLLSKEPIPLCGVDHGWHCFDWLTVFCHNQSTGRYHINCPVILNHL